MPPPFVGGEGMTGDRASRDSPTVHIGQWRTQPHNPGSPGTQELAPLGVAVKAKPPAGVDLRSSLDPDPSLAPARTYREPSKNGHKLPRLGGLTRPRSFRNDPPLSQMPLPEPAFSTRPVVGQRDSACCRSL